MNADDRRRYRETAQWRRLAAQTVADAGGWCEVCCRQPASEAHHVDPATYGREEESELPLVAVCHDCHVNICHPAWGERLARERYA